MPRKSPAFALLRQGALPQGSTMAHHHPMASIEPYQMTTCENTCGKKYIGPKGHPDTGKRDAACKKPGHTLHRVRYRKPDGKQTDKSGFRTKRLAEDFAATVEVKKMTGEYIDPSAGRVTIGVLGDHWTTNRAGVTPNTVAGGDSAWSVHVRPYWGHRPVGDARKSEIREWVAGMQRDGVGVPTIEKALGQLRQILSAAVDDRLISSNPCDGVKAPKRKHNQRGYLAHGQVFQLANEIRAHSLFQYSVMVLFLAYTGLRFGEMAALKVKSFDMLRRRVNITEAVAEVKGALVWGNVKTHERRAVPFPAFLAKPLAKLMEGKNRDDLVFTTERGHALRLNTWRSRVFAPAMRRCIIRAEMERTTELARHPMKPPTTPEFPPVTPHDLRHTAVSLSISAGANVKAIQTMVGHKSAAMTLDTYADLFPDDLESVAAALDAAMRIDVGDLWETALAAV